MKNLTHSLAHVSTRLFDVPLLIAQSKLIVILDALGPRLGLIEVQRPAQIEDTWDPSKHAERFSHFDAMIGMSQKVQFRRKEEGHYIGGSIAVVPIIGTLVQRSDFMSSYSGLVSYSEIERMMSAAMQDPEVSEIIMELDTPGGEVAGAFDTADRIAEMRGKGKKITAVATEFAASAGYLLASAADEIVLPRTGAVGSIGVVTAHYDVSKAMAKKGVAVTFIYAGDKKVQGNSYQPLEEGAKAEIQDQIDSMYTLFVETVARNIGMDQKAIRATQAGMYTGFKAVEVGLAKRVNSFGNELDMAVTRYKGMSGPFRLKTPAKEISMDEEQRKAEAVKAEAAKAEAVKAEAARVEAAKAEAAKAEAAKAEADNKDSATAARTAERERIMGIQNCPEAKGREQLVAHFIATGTSVEEAKKALALCPQSNGSRFEQAMATLSAGGAIPNVEGGAGPAELQIESSADLYSRRNTKVFGQKKLTA